MGIIDRPYMGKGPHDKSPHTPTHRPPPPAKPYQFLLFLLVLISLASLIYSYQPRSLWLPTFHKTESSHIPTAPTVPTTALSTQHVIVNNPPSLSIDPYRKYLDKIDQGSTGLRQLAFELLHPCRPADKSCAAVHLFHFVQANVGYLSDPPARDYIQSPEETLKIKAGDCEDLSILLASLLNNSGVPTYLVFTPDHAYTLACGVEPTEMRKVLARDLRTEQRQVTIYETHQIQGQSGKSWTLPMPKATEVHYKMTSDQPIDVLFFTSAEEYQHYQAHQQSRTYLCSRRGIYQMDETCRVAPGALLVVMNSGKEDSRVLVDIQYSVPSQTVSGPGNMTTYTINGQSCVVLDPSIKGLAYPGQMMEGASRAPYRTAINVQGTKVNLGL